VFDLAVTGGTAWRRVMEGARELWVGGSLVQATLFQVAAPGLLDRYMSKPACDGHLRSTRNPHRPDSFFGPPEGGPGVRGRFGARATSQAAILDPAKARAAIGPAAIGGLVTTAALRLARK
jgi:hypothetical protein